ncbi:MAG: peptidase, partial [Variibacter sp.]|nr:peptidase [Variibacter sp.]
RVHQKPLTLCGELASRPIGALALVALGFRSLSLSPSAVGPIKSMLLELDLGRASRLLDELLDRPAEHISLRQELSAFAALEGLQF